MDMPHFQLEAVPYADLQLTKRTLSGTMHDAVIWVHMPACFASGYLLYEVKEVEPNNGELPGLGGATQDTGHPWIRFAAEVLNWSNGYHVYQLNLLDESTQEPTSLYFAYHVHSSQPPKDYVYMDRES